MNVGQSAVFGSFGKPEEVLKVEGTEIGAPGPGQVLLKMLAAPINPADLNFIEGVYGIKPELPSRAGLEGCGEVMAVGEGIRGFSPGEKAMVLRGYGTWATHFTLAAEDLLRLPDTIDPRQAAMLKVNPMTAWLMITGGREAPPPGTWIAQNAANSGVGQCVIQVARALGLRTLNFVRRPEAIPALEALGADIVALDEPGMVENAPARPVLAFNAVGGDSATRLMDLLADGGKLVTYGAMSRQGVKVPNKFLIFKGISLEGFWLTRWLNHAKPEMIAAAYDRLAGMMGDGNLQISVEARYPLAEVREAIVHAKQEKRGGKILLSMDG